VSSAAPFERLAKLIEHELELAGQGRVDELLDAVTARGEYLETLPHPAPVEARGALERATALHARVIIETERVREGLGHSQAAVLRAHRVALSYASKPDQRYSTSA